MNRLQNLAQKPSSVDRETYGAAYRQGYGLTRRFLLSRGVRSEDVEDVAQWAWTRGWERISDLRRPDRIVAWINTIALNSFRNKLRSERPNVELGDIAQASQHQTVVALDVSRQLSRCKPSDSKLLRQYYVEGYTSVELARLWGCKPTSIRVRLLRARRRLARSLDPPCGRSEQEQQVSWLGGHIAAGRKEQNNESDSMAPTSAHTVV